MGPGMGALKIDLTLVDFTEKGDSGEAPAKRKDV